MVNFGGFSLLLNEQSSEKSNWSWVCLHIFNSNILKIWYWDGRLPVRDTRISNFVIKYLRKNKIGRETFLAYSNGAQVESFEQHKNRDKKSRATVPLTTKLKDSKTNSWNSSFIITKSLATNYVLKYSNSKSSSIF